MNGLVTTWIALLLFLIALILLNAKKTYEQDDLQKAKKKIERGESIVEYPKSGTVIDFKFACFANQNDYMLKTNSTTIIAIKREED